MIKPLLLRIGSDVKSIIEVVTDIYKNGGLEFIPTNTDSNS